MNFREELLNKMLTDAWDKYAGALETGTLVQLEDEAASWVDNVLHAQLLPAIQAENGHLD